MSMCVIFNPNAGSADDWPELRQRLEADESAELCPTQGPDDAPRLASEAARRGHDTVVAAGGDGTVHAVVNGMVRSRSRMRLGILPLGTGNDLPRTLGIPEDPLAALDVIREGRTTTIDLIRVRTGMQTVYCCNVAAGGFTGQVNEAVTDEIKQTWGPLAYLRGAVKVLPDLTRYETTIRYNGSAAKRVPVMNVIVANGRSAGGGIVVAPHANPEDGLLDVIIVRSGTVMELTGVAARLMAGDYTDSDLVTHRRAQRVEVDSNPGMLFNVDGELLTDRRIAFSVAPAALRVIVGRDYSPTAPDATST